jgi:GNAT superfamily N-acetyltransferase
LAEIRSLAVDADSCYQGIGRQLVMSAEQEAKDLGISQIFALTYQLGILLLNVTIMKSAYKSCRKRYGGMLSMP